VTAKRALAQHSGRFARDAADVAKAIADLKDAQARLEASGGSIVSLLPNHLRSPANPIHEALSPSGLAGRIEVEAYRLDRSRPKPRPGYTYEDNASGRIAPMVKTLADLVARVRSEFDSPPPPMPQEAPPVVRPNDAVSSPAGGSPEVTTRSGTTAGVDQPQTQLGHQGRLTGVAVSLRGGQQTLVEMTEPFAPPSEQDGSEQARSAVVKAAVETAGEDMACGQERATAQGAVDYRKLF
jgi:hypothetical protein